MFKSKLTDKRLTSYGAAFKGNFRFILPIYVAIQCAPDDTNNSLTNFTQINFI